MTPAFLFAWTAVVYLFSVFLHEGVNELEPVKQLKYAVSVEYIRLSQTQWWNRIEPTAHYLGAQPQVDLDHAALIDVDSILMVLEEFEESGGWYHTPVQRTQWESMGLRVWTVRARDWRQLRFTELDEGVQFLRWETAHNRSVYVHCKAGRGRSAAIMWAYLTLAYDMEPVEALTLLTRQRPSVHMNARQREAVLDYVKYQKCHPRSERCETTPFLARASPDQLGPFHNSQ